MFSVFDCQIKNSFLLLNMSFVFFVLKNNSQIYTNIQKLLLIHVEWYIIFRSQFSSFGILMV